jgi:hypothetical protein
VSTILDASPADQFSDDPAHCRFESLESIDINRDVFSARCTLTYPLPTETLTKKLDGTMPTEGLPRRWHDHSFVLEGFIIPDPTSCRAERILSMAFPDTTVHVVVTRSCIQRRDAPIAAEILRLPDGRLLRHWVVLNEPWDRSDLERAYDAMVLNDQVSYLVKSRGRARLEDDPSHPWRELVAEADRLQRKYPGYRQDAIANLAGIPGPTYDAKARRLREWRRRLKRESAERR